ncbi:hypothetical protein [Leuconostoc lactis]|nr:hypothetical protein [Leuconostoc lactis]
MLIFGGLFLILAIQVRFNLLFMHVMNDGAELAVHNFMPQLVQQGIGFAGLLNHYWLAMLGIIGLSGLLYLVNYKIAMGWLIATQVLGLLVIELLSMVLTTYWDKGFKMGSMMPDFLLVWWFQILAVIAAIIVPRLTADWQWQWGIQLLVVFGWCLMALARMQQNGMLLSSELGALCFGYFWWQLSEQQYRRHAKHWRRVLEIDTLI